MSINPYATPFPRATAELNNPFVFLNVFPSREIEGNFEGDSFVINFNYCQGPRLLFWLSLYPRLNPSINKAPLREVSPYELMNWVDFTAICGISTLNIFNDEIESTIAKIARDGGRLFNLYN